jgi:polysaccharide chain length determinant protein (PEP-CTERM system associated)
MQQLFGQLLTYIKEIWQYRWYAALFSWIVCLVGWAAIYFIPNSYEVSARVFVDTQGILRPLLTGLTVQLNVEQQIFMMTRTLISRPNIEKVVRMARLDANMKNPEEREVLINRLLRQIEVKSTGKENLYTITYADRSPETAKNVVQSLLTIFVEGSIGEKRKDTDQARQFIDEQIKTYEQKLIQAENALKEFKQKNLGYTPGKGPGQDYFSRLAETNATLAQARLEYQQALNGRDALQKQISGSEPAGQLTANPELEARILALRKNMDNMRLNFTEEHPDIVGTKRVLAQLEQQRRAEIEERKRNGGAVNIRQDSGTQSVRLALAQADANVASLRARVAEYERRYGALKAAADKEPQIEAEYTQLNRDYDVNKQNYEKLLARRDSAQMSGDVDAKTGVFDFRIIDPPRAPLAPSSPNRPYLMFLALLGGIGGGIGLAFVLSQLKPTFTDRKALREGTGLPILGSVSMVWTNEERNKRKKNFAALAASYGALAVAYGGILVALAMLTRPA